MVFDESGEWKVVEKVSEVSPNVRIAVFSQTFVVESIHLCDLSGFVVSSQDGDAISISQFEGNEEGHSFYRVVAAVDVVTEEEISCVGGTAADLQELHQAVLAQKISKDGTRQDLMETYILAVDVAADCEH